MGGDNPSRQGSTVQVVMQDQLDPRSDSPTRRSGCPANLIAIILFNLDIETINFFLILKALGSMLYCMFFSTISFPPLPLMIFQGCCQLNCYSKDPVMTSMNVSQ